MIFLVGGRPQASVPKLDKPDSGCHALAAWLLWEDTAQQAFPLSGSLLPGGEVAA